MGMKLLHLHPVYDTGGQSAAAKKVLEAGGDEVRVFVKKQHPFGYADVGLWDIDAVRESYRWADVVVIHNEPTLHELVSDGSDKAVFVHHHGSKLRLGPFRADQARAIGARQLVSTVDLLLVAPDATWMPQVVDVPRMESIGAACRPDDRPIVISHAPTVRSIKGTRFVIDAKRQLRGRAEVNIIEREPWLACLALKAASHIFVDQIGLGYGNNAIEAWAMGLPVVAGADRRILERMAQEFPIPFIQADRGSLLPILTELIASPALREEWAAKGRAHVDRFHAPDAWAKRARVIYAAAPAEAAA